MSAPEDEPPAMGIVSHAPASGGGGRRIVAYVRYQPAIDPDANLEERDRLWAELARPLLDRASALGGRVVGWGHDFVCVDFAWDALYDAIDFLVDAPLAPDLASGLAHGALVTLLDSARAAPAVGVPLRRAAELAELARPGEVLVSPELVQASAGRLKTSGEAGKRHGKPQVAALLLDLDGPLQDPQTSDRAPVAFESDEPSSLRGPQLARLASAAEAVSTSSLFPAAMADALGRRDSGTLRELVASLREQHSDGLAERLDAMASLASGHSGDAIRRLRDAKQATVSQEPSARCRATLALGVAFSAAGRPYEAILEALEALAQARLGADDRGERACARFLANLAQTLGDPEAAAAWSGLSSHV